MAKEYGINYCKKVICDLEAIEEGLFREKGHGFDRFSQEYLNLLKYKRLLKEFEGEKARNAIPSYRPEIHGP